MPIDGWPRSVLAALHMGASVNPVTTATRWRRVAAAGPTERQQTVRCGPSDEDGDQPWRKDTSSPTDPTNGRAPSRRRSQARAQSKPVRGRRVGAGEEWAEFESASAAARELGLHQGNVSAVARGELKQTGGYEFELLPQ